MSLAETAKLAVQIDLTGNLNAGLTKAARALQGFDKHTSNTQRSLGKLSSNLQRGIVLGATAAAGGFIAVAKAAGDFEAQLNTIGTIVDKGQLPKIGTDLRKIARETGLSLDDLTSAYYDLASAGVKGTLATAALDDAVKLSIGGLATTTETVNLMTTAINAYGLDAAGAAKATDQFAQAIADGTVKADAIAATFANVASVAKAYGVGIDQIAASFAYLTAQGVPAAEVTTEMQRAIVSLVAPTAELAAAGKKLGVSWDEEIRKKGLVPALQEIVTYANKNKIPLIDMFGRIEAVKYALQTTGPNLKGFTAELAKMGTASGVAAQQMAARQQGLNFQLGLLKAGVKDAAITIGSDLLPKLTPLLKKLNDFLNLPATQGKISEFATKLADGFTKLVDAIGKVDWQPFINGLKISSDIAKDAIGIFRSLPEGLQAALVGGFAVNKLTGGLPTSIAKDVGGSLIGHFADRGSSAGNPLYVADVTGGIGKGIGGGGIKGALAGIAKVAVIGIAAGVIADLASVLAAQSSANKETEADLADQTRTFTGGASLADLKQSLRGIDEQIDKADRGIINAYALNIDGVRDSLQATRQSLVDAINKAQHAGTQEATRSSERLEAQFGANGDRATMDARRIEAEENGTGMVVKASGERVATATIQNGLRTAAHLSALGAKFGHDIHSLRAATKPLDIAKFARAIAADVTKGAGSVAGTQGVLKDLRIKLAETHDPKLQAVLRAAIHDVQKKLPERQWVDKELALGKKIAGSSDSTTKRIVDLKAIETSLRSHGDRHAAATIHKLEQQIAATDRVRTAALETRQAVKDKDSSITVNTKTATYLNGRIVEANLSRYSSRTKMQVS